MRRGWDQEIKKKIYGWRSINRRCVARNFVSMHLIFSNCFKWGKKSKLSGCCCCCFWNFFFIDSCIYRNRCIFLSFFFWLLANAQSFCVFVMAGKGTGGGEGGGGGAGGVVGGKEKLSE